MGPAVIGRGLGTEISSADQDDRAESGADRGKSAGRWNGATVVIVASGPSLTAEDVSTVQAWRAASQGKVIAVCTTFRMVPWADVVYACDARWWRVYGEEALRVCSGEFWSAFGAIGSDWDGVHEKIRRRLQFIDVVDHEGLSTKAGRVSSGKNSGAQAIGLAYQWAWQSRPGIGVLLGYDMQRTGGKSHFHGNHDGGLPNLGNLQEWCRLMVILGRDLRDRGVRIINATRSTALPWFEQMPLDQALSQ